MKLHLWIMVLVFSYQVVAFAADSAEELKAKVAQQDGEAAFKLGFKYYYGDDEVQRDYKHALTLFENSINWGKEPTLPNYFIGKIKAKTGEDQLPSASEPSADLKDGNDSYLSADSAKTSERNLIHVAAMLGDMAKLKQILSADPSQITNRMADGETLLHVAAYSGKLSAVQYLIQHGADLESLAAKNSTPLYEAALGGKTAVASFLIENGANVNMSNTCGQTPLMIATINDTVSVASILLANKAKVNSQDAYGVTALEYAVVSSDTNLVELLIDYGADANIADHDGYTPLMQASYSGAAPIAAILIDHNAIVNAQSKGGETALHLAARAGQIDIVKYLVESKADINATNQKELTPLDWSELEWHPDVSDFLRAHGGMHGADLKGSMDEANSQATQSSGDQDLKYREAIDNVVKQYDQASMELTNAIFELKKNPLEAGLTSASSDAMNKYGDDLKKIDTSECPLDFRIAFIKYYQAVYELKNYNDTVTGVRGVLNGLFNGFGALVNLPNKTDNAADPLTKAAEELVLVCTKYGVVVK